MTRKKTTEPKDPAIELLRIEKHLQQLREWMPPGTTVYTVKRHTDRSGIGHVVAVLIVIDGKIKNISGWICETINRKWDSRDGLWTGSEFDLVQKLSYVLHGEKDKGVPKKYRGEYWPGPKATTPRSYRAGYSLIHQQL